MARSPHLKKLVTKLRAYPVAVAAVLAALVFAGLLFVRSASLDSLESNLNEREQEWQRINSNLKRARDLTDHLSRIKEIQSVVAGRLMDPEERAINYDYFYSLEKKSGVRLVSLNQSGVIATKNATLAGIDEFKEYELIGYAITVEGNFEQIVHFLTSVTSGRHFARISGFTVSYAQQAAASVLSVNLQMQILGVPRES